MVAANPPMEHTRCSPPEPKAPGDQNGFGYGDYAQHRLQGGECLFNREAEDVKGQRY
jgi:hypothetical protein